MLSSLPSSAGLLAAGLSYAPMSTASGAAGSVEPRHGAASSGGARHIAFTRWAARSFGDGRYLHTRDRHGLVIGSHPDRVAYRDPYGSSGRVPYDRGRWYSPWATQHFDLTELIASYDARTPVGTFIEISVRGRTASDQRSSWDSLGRWASYDGGFHRMSLGTQSDDFSSVFVDTW